jgi:tetratricopeptide (TPR) repeat protein
LGLRAIVATFAETPEANDEALRLLSRAREINPRYPPTNALAAWCLQARYVMEWPGAQADDKDLAAQLARTAIAEGADTPLALVVGGAVCALLMSDRHSAVAAVDRAMTLNSNSAVVLSLGALIRCLCGAHDKAIEHAQRAMRLSPAEPLIYLAAFALAFASLLTNRAGEAITHARKAIEGNRNFAFSYCVLALACAQLGQSAEAAQAVHDLLRVAPRFHIGTLRRIPAINAALERSDLTPLSAAGLPE